MKRSAAEIAFETGPPHGWAPSVGDKAWIQIGFRRYTVEIINAGEWTHPSGQTRPWYRAQWGSYRITCGLNSVRPKPRKARSKCKPS